MNRPLVYIAGPYSSDPVGNTRQAIATADRLAALGVDAYVPHLSLLHDIVAPRPHAAWVALDLNIVRRCDAIYRIPGVSAGADEETAYAEQHAIPVLHNDIDVVQFLADTDPRLI